MRYMRLPRIPHEMIHILDSDWVGWELRMKNWKTINISPLKVRWLSLVRVTGLSFFFLLHLVFLDDDRLLFSILSHSLWQNNSNILLSVFFINFLYLQPTYNHWGYMKVEGTRKSLLNEQSTSNGIKRWIENEKISDKVECNFLNSYQISQKF